LFNEALSHDDVWGSAHIAPCIFDLGTIPDGGEWSASCLGCFTPGEKTAGTHWIRGWVCPRAGQDTLAKRINPSSWWELNPSHLACSNMFCTFKALLNHHITKLLRLQMLTTNN